VRIPYTWGLLSSMPDLTTSNDTELIAIPGTPPDLLHPVFLLPFLAVLL
jgi:oligopeptide transport system ATP-binding protein